MLSTSRWLLASVLALFAAACATGVEGETPDDGVVGDGNGSRGGDSGGGGTGSTDGGVDPDGGTTGCPAGMVKVPSSTGAYCIDATEVTNEAYAKFLATNPSTSNQPTSCAWNDSFVPGTWPAASGEEKHPVTEVDWCDARAYCAWAGKRLCGRIGGGTLPYADFADPKKSEWYNACSAEGTREYPYAGTYDAQACNGVDKELGNTVEVGSLETCEGSVPGLFDMSGNVLEWEDSCDGETGDKDLCQARGGAYGDNRDTLKCKFPFGLARSTKLPRIGFRCCR